MNRDERDELIRQALVAERAGDLQRATGLLESIVNADPHDVSARAWLGWLYAEQEQYAAAVEMLQAAILLDPNHARSHAILAEVLLVLERFPEGEASAKSSLAIEPKSSTYVVLGAAQSAQGKSADAIASFRRAIEFDCTNEEAMYNLALEVRSADPPEATRLLESAIELDPNYWDAHREYGFQFLLGNDTARAERALRHAISGNPSDSTAYVYLGNLLASRGQWEEAEGSYSRARGLSPLAALPNWTLANLYEAQGRKSDAAALYRQAVEVAPLDSEAAFQFARFLLSIGQKDEGTLWLISALKLRPGHQAAMQLKQQMDAKKKE